MKKLLLLLLIQVSVQSQNILFIGNSLTYSNNMPHILEYIGEKNGVYINTENLSLPNYCDH